VQPKTVQFCNHGDVIRVLCACIWIIIWARI